MKKIIISDKIFEKYPTFRRGIIIINDIEITPGSKRIKRMLDKEIESKKSLDVTQIKEVQIWDEAHKDFGSNPNEYYPSIKSLLLRIKTTGFPFINSAVGAFNYISLKYLIPCGGDDIDKIKGDLKLDLSTGTEQFIPLGKTELDNPAEGEVIFFDTATNNIMCRRWNWRNGDITKITSQTKHLVINIDGIQDADVIAPRDDLAEVLKTHCKANLRVDLLDKDHQEITLPWL